VSNGKKVGGKEQWGESEQKGIKGEKEESEGRRGQGEEGRERSGISTIASMIHEEGLRKWKGASTNEWELHTRSDRGPGKGRGPWACHRLQGDGLTAEKGEQVTLANLAWEREVWSWAVRTEFRVEIARVARRSNQTLVAVPTLQLVGEEDVSWTEPEGRESIDASAIVQHKKEEKKEESLPSLDCP
jgi:hypothetical protein